MVVLIHFPGEKVCSQTVTVAEISVFLSIQNFSECLAMLYHSLKFKQGKRNNCIEKKNQTYVLKYISQLK